MSKQLLLECRHLEAELGPKALQYVKDVGTLDRQCYTTVPVYLQMVTTWRDRKWLAQLRSGSHWLGEETGRHIGQPREQRLCRRCKCGAIDDADDMVSTAPHSQRSAGDTHSCSWQPEETYVLSTNKARSASQQSSASATTHAMQLQQHRLTSRKDCYSASCQAQVMHIHISAALAKVAGA